MDSLTWLVSSGSVVYSSIISGRGKRSDSGFLTGHAGQLSGHHLQRKQQQFCYHAPMNVTALAVADDFELNVVLIKEIKPFSGIVACMVKGGIPRLNHTSLTGTNISHFDTNVI